MIAYHQEWSEAAQDLLIEIWLNAKDRKTVSLAEHRAEKMLEKHPQTAGRELSEGLWQIIVPPLKLFYEIDEDKRLVTVTHVECT